jgi:DNA-binding CsgD family transcriptional regulator
MITARVTGGYCHRLPLGRERPLTSSSLGTGKPDHRLLLSLREPLGSFKLNSESSRKPVGAEITHGFTALTSRQVEVLEVIARGLTNSQIGRVLNMSKYTVAQHIKEMLKKTGCINRTDLVNRAHENGMLKESAAEGPTEAVSATFGDHLMLELHEDESGFGGAADLASRSPGGTR